MDIQYYKNTKFLNSIIILLSILLIGEFFLFVIVPIINYSKGISGNYTVVTKDTNSNISKAMIQLDECTQDQLRKNNKGRIDIILKQVNKESNDRNNDSIFKTEIFYYLDGNRKEMKYFSIISNLKCTIFPPTVNRNCEIKETESVIRQLNDNDSTLIEAYNKIK